MAIERNMARHKPSFIIAQDVKSGYNNVVIADLLQKFKTVQDRHYSQEIHEEVNGIDLIE